MEQRRWTHRGLCHDVATADLARSSVPYLDNLGQSGAGRRKGLTAAGHTGELMDFALLEYFTTRIRRHTMGWE